MQPRKGARPQNNPARCWLFMSLKDPLTGRDAEDEPPSLNDCLSAADISTAWPQASVILCNRPSVRAYANASAERLVLCVYQVAAACYLCSARFRELTETLLRGSI